MGKSRDQTPDGRGCQSPQLADRLALYDLWTECKCPRPPRFVTDDTPPGVTLWFDGLGGLKRCYLHAGVIYSPLGPLEPGGLPLIVCSDEPAPHVGRTTGQRKRTEAHSWNDWLGRAAERFRRKGFRVQLSHQRPDSLAGDVLPPITPERKTRKKAVG